MDLFKPEQSHEFSYQEKKSRFIAYFSPLDDISEINEIINNRKKLHHKARHHPYAAVIGNYQKYSDDGEPAGTAGQPILVNLKSRKLTNCIIITSRYFGGIKLGKGGLARAFSFSAAEVISRVKLLKAYNALFISISTDYPVFNDLKKILENFHLLSYQENFTNKVNIELAIPAEEKLNFTNQISPIQKNININMVGEKIIFSDGKLSN